jgi:hypothetical protein
MDLVSSLRRRWILTCGLLLLTIAATLLGILKLAPTYQSQSSVILLASQTAAKAYGGNPYLAFNSTLNQTADVVRYELMDQRTVAALDKAGFRSIYLVTDAIDTSGPVLIITATGHDRSSVERTLSGVTSEAGAKLAGLQATLLPVNKIRSVVITFQPKPTTVASKKLRPLSVIAGGGLLLTIGIPLLVDAIIIRRRAERSASSSDDERGTSSSSRMPEPIDAERRSYPGDDLTAPLRRIKAPIARSQSQPSGAVAQAGRDQEQQPETNATREQQSANRP